MNGAFFLDRDGTINFDRVYINNPELMELIEGAARAIKRIKDHGYKVFVVTNQSGIARGLISPDALPLINRRLNNLLLQKAQTSIDDFLICPHHEDENCECRKPKTKLMENIAKAQGIDLKKSFFIGDKLSDVEAGLNIGATSILVRTGKGKDSEWRFCTEKKFHNRQPHYIADDLRAAVDWALESSSKDSTKV